jgi:hypothetical protein
LGCVDLTPPWNVHDGADAYENVTGGTGGGGGSETIPEDAADAPPSDVGATPWNDVGVATEAIESSPIEESDAPDGCDDSAVPDSKDAGKEDLARDQTALEPDIGWADTFRDTPPSSSDGNLEAPVHSGLLVSYPCESASGAELPDISGHGKNATLANGSGGSSPVGFSFSAGRVGNALTLSSDDKAYVKLPSGIVSHFSQITVATWVKLDSTVAFQRIFDFGVDTNTFMYLVNSSGSGGVRFRIASASGKNQVIEGAAPVPKDSWTHVAVTLGDDGVAIYLDGAQVALQAPALLRPSDLGETANNFIGRSAFASDPYLGGKIDEFRIYGRVLSASEIGELASGQ